MPSKLTLPAISASAIELSHRSGSAIDLDLIAGRNPIHRTLEAHHAWDTELARHNRGMGQQASALDHNGGGIAEQRDPTWIGMARHQNFPARQELAARIADHTGPRADRSGATTGGAAHVLISGIGTLL